MGFGLDDPTLFIHNSGLQVITALSLIYILQFTVTYALGFSAFTSRILATDLSQSYYHLKSHMKYYFHSLILFLPLSCKCQFRRLDSVQFLCSQARILVGWCLETGLLLFCTQLTQTTFFIHLQPLVTDHAENSLFIVEKAYLEFCFLTLDVPLLCPYACARLCLPNSYLAMGLYVTIN
jgi:hypothetical protein